MSYFVAVYGGKQGSTWRLMSLTVNQKQAKQKVVFI